MYVGDIEADGKLGRLGLRRKLQRLKYSYLTVTGDDHRFRVHVGEGLAEVCVRFPGRQCVHGLKRLGVAEINVIQRIHISPVRRLRRGEGFLLAGERRRRRRSRVRGLRRGAACERQHQQSAERGSRDPSPHTPTLTGAPRPPTELSTADAREAGDLARGCGSPASGRADGTAPRALRVGHEEWSRDAPPWGCARSGNAFPLRSGSSLHIPPGSSLSPARVNATRRPCRRCARIMTLGSSPDPWLRACTRSRRPGTAAACPWRPGVSSCDDHRREPDRAASAPGRAA